MIAAVLAVGILERSSRWVNGSSDRTPKLPSRECAPICQTGAAWCTVLSRRYSARLGRVQLFALRCGLHRDPMRLRPLGQGEDEFEHAMAIRRLHMLRVDLLRQRKLTLEPAVRDFADDGLRLVVCTALAAYPERPSDD